MEQTKKEQLEHIINTNIPTHTIHKLLQLLAIKKREVVKLEKNEPDFYEALKNHCELIVANLYELVVERPRQSQQYLALAKEQEAFFNTLFAEDVDNAIVPEIIIKRENSATSINIVDAADDLQ